MSGLSVSLIFHIYESQHVQAVAEAFLAIPAVTALIHSKQLARRRLFDICIFDTVEDAA